MSDQAQHDVTLAVSMSPHVRDEATVGSIMWKVVGALVPALVASWFFFGWYAPALVVFSMACAMVFEGLWQKIAGQPVTVLDGSAAVTGMLFAFVLPANATPGMVVVGNLVAIVVGKQLFGGLGKNIWNPALVARAWVHFSWPALMNQGEWPMMKGDLGLLARLGGSIFDTAGATADAVSRATPLSTEAIGTMFSNTATQMYRYYELAVGFRPGCIGEVSALLLALGGVYLVGRKIIKWYVPVVYIGTVGVMALFLPYGKGMPSSFGFHPEMALYQMLAGGLFLGAIFMATDMVTSPLSRRGLIVFAAGCGILTALIRLYGGYPEGVCFSILIMNTAVPLIDRYTRPRVFGTKAKA